MIFNNDSLLSFGAVIFFTTMLIIKDKNKTKRLLDLVRKPLFTINILIVLVFSYYMLNSPEDTEESKRKKEATKQALLGLLIALMAHLEMKIAPFWLIFCASYFLKA
jgi:hypothetical protein